MQRGMKFLVWLLVAALCLGALVLMLHPAYRDAFQALRRGEPDRSLIWQSNRDYYDQVIPGEDDEEDALDP